MSGLIKACVVADGTPEGLYTVVYQYFYGGLRPTGIHDRLGVPIQQTLGDEYVYLQTDFEQARKVYDAIESTFKATTRDRIYRALCSHETDKLFDIFRFILLAFKDPLNADNYEQLDFVVNVRKLARNVGHEAHLLTGFTRFRKTEDGILYADISPKNNVLHYVCEHFQNRLGGERWVIHDVSRGVAGAYDTNECVIAPVPSGLVFTEDSRDADYQRLWTAFYRAIGIQERYNNKLRIQMSAKYFWKHMTEHKLRFFDE